MHTTHPATHAPTQESALPATDPRAATDSARQAPLRHVASGSGPFTTAYLRVHDDAHAELVGGGVPAAKVDEALERLAALRNVGDVETHALVSSSDGRFAVRAFHEPVRHSQVTVGNVTRLGPWLELSALSPSMLVLLAHDDCLEVVDVGPGAVGPSSRNLGLLDPAGATALARRIEPDITIVVGAADSLRHELAVDLAGAGTSHLQFIDPETDDEPLADQFTRVSAHHASQSAVAALTELRSARAAGLVVEGRSLIGHQLSGVLRLIATDDVEIEREMVGTLSLVDSAVHRAVRSGVPVSMVPTVDHGGPLAGVAAILPARDRFEVISS